MKIKHLLSVILKKTDYSTKINEIENKITDHDYGKYLTTPKCNKLTAENFAARLAQGNLVTKTDFDDEMKNLNKKINSNKTNLCLLKMN